MRTRPLFSPEQEAILVAAIAEAEQGNRGEVRLHVERYCPTDPLERAAALFEALGMGATRYDTGVLLYVATEDRACAVFAGEGVLGAEQPGFWQDVADALANGYARRDPIGGFEMALLAIGDLLRRYAPGEDDAGDELPNLLSTGAV